MRHFITEYLVIDEVGQSIQQISALFSLDFSEDHQVFRRLIEAVSAHSSHVIVPALLSLFDLLKSLSNFAKFSIMLCVGLTMLVMLTIDLLLLVADVDQLKRISLELLLELAHVTSFTEESFGGGAELVFKDLFAFKISTFGTLHKLVTIVLVTNLEVIKGVEE